MRQISQAVPEIYGVKVSGCFLNPRKFLKRYLQNWKYYAKNSKSYIYHIFLFFSEKQWNMVFMYVIRWRIWRWFQKLLQILCGTNGSLSRPKLVLNIGNFKEFRNIRSKNGLSREPLVPERNRYMKTLSLIHISEPTRP